MDPGFRQCLTSGSCDTTRARHDYTAWLSDEGIDPIVVEDWAVVFSELTHNACTAAPTGTEIVVEAAADERLVLRVANVTTGTVPTLPKAVDPDEVSGRGLLIAATFTGGIEIEIDDARVQITCIGSRRDARPSPRTEPAPPAPPALRPVTDSPVPPEPDSTRPPPEHAG